MGQARNRWQIRCAAAPLLCALGVLMAVPSSASAASCADYSTQADAQRAADTRDADSDGIYCEALPCPCLMTGKAAPKSIPKPKATPRRPLGKRPLTARAQITRVISTTIVNVRIARASRSRGLRSEERVRLIGIDAPKTTECGGAEAQARLLRLAFGDTALDTNADGLADREPSRPLQSGALVDLRTDPKLGTRDSTGRLLAYVTGTHTGTELAERYTRAAGPHCGTQRPWPPAFNASPTPSSPRSGAAPVPGSFATEIFIVRRQNASSDSLRALTA